MKYTFYFMQELKELWYNSLFSDLIVTLILCVACYLSITNRSKHPEYRFFPIYFFSFLLLELTFYSAYFFIEGSPTYDKLDRMTHYFDIVVTFIELLTFMYFFHFILKNERNKKIIIWLTLVFITLSLSLIINDIFDSGKLYYGSSTTIYILECVCFIVSCVFYYKELFTGLPKVNLFREPNFWTVSGVAFFSICTLPITFTLNYFQKTDYVTYQTIFIVINVFYILLFLMIIKSYLCKVARSV